MDSLQATHVHFGPGSLGLGLPIERSSGTTNLTTLVVGREASSNRDAVESLMANRGFRHQMAEGVREVYFDKFLRTDVNSEVGDLTSQFRVNQPLVITTAVKNGQPSMAVLLSELLTARRESTPAPTFLIPCENIVHPTIENLNRLANSEQTKIVFTNMVDRMCEPVAIVNGWVQVETEMYSKWMIEPPADLAESAELSSSFHFVAEELGIEVRHDCAIQKELKFLLMNGTHACFALLAIEYGFSELTTFGHTAEGRSVLETTLDEFCVVMKARFPMFPQSELMETRSQFAKRILSHTKDVAAVLSRLKPDSYADLIADLGKKLTDPYDTLLKVSGAVSGDEFMIGRALEVLKDLLRAGFDIRELRNGDPLS